MTMFSVLQLGKLTFAPLSLIRYAPIKGAGSPSKLGTIEGVVDPNRPLVPNYAKLHKHAQNQYFS